MTMASRETRSVKTELWRMFWTVILAGVLCFFCALVIG